MAEMARTPRPRRLSGRDDGFTLPEMIITIAIMGTVTAVLAAAIVTTLRQQSSTEGRVNVARAEQSIDSWLPADIASADPASISDDPADTPCGPCPGGVNVSGKNVLMMSWAVTEPAPTTWTVSYRYMKAGSEWQLRRVLCEDGPSGLSCESYVVVHALAPPGDGSAAAEAAFLADPTQKPDWAIQITPPPPGGSTTSVKVIIDGGGGSGGTGGGSNEIVLSVDGVTPSTILPNTVTNPSFVRAKSRCGGPMTFVIDTSGSIGSTNMGKVRDALDDVIEGFKGTPVSIQIIDFDNTARPLGGDWNRFYDMASVAEADELKVEVSTLVAGGGTNWDDGWYRTFYQGDNAGSLRGVLPNTVIFFTDGNPNRHRAGGASYRTDSQSPIFPAPYDSVTWPRTTEFDQQSYDRAERTAETFFGQTRYIGVAVGGLITTNLDPGWYQVPDPYTQSPPSPDPSWGTGGDAVQELIKAGGLGTVEQATPANGPFTNADTANYYAISNYDYFDDALIAASLSDCGGTLTVQTSLGGSPAPDEFVYENSEYRDAATGTVLSTTQPQVTTSALFRTGTFDFDISGGATYDVDITVQELATLDDYAPDLSAGPGGWTCRAGGVDKTSSITLIPIDTTWSGITIPITANEAASCTLHVVTT